MRSWVIGMVAAAVTWVGSTNLLIAQQPTADTIGLSLADALAQARANSPTYRQSLNDAKVARWSVRNARASTYLPSLSVNGGFGYSGSGSSQFGGTIFNQSSSTISSSYGLGISWQLSGATLVAPKLERANQRAVEQDIEGADVLLQGDITLQYLNVLQSVASTVVARQAVDRADVQLRFAEARLRANQATQLDVKQAQVQKGQAEVALLRAQQTENDAKLELFRRMGIPAPANVETVRLTDSLGVSEPKWQLSELLASGLAENPRIRATKEREVVARYSVRSQKSRYLPSLSLSAGLNGFTQQFTNENFVLASRLGAAQGSYAQCLYTNSIIRSLPGGGIDGIAGNGINGDCAGSAGLDASGQTLLPAVQEAALDQNRKFPFRFANSPFSISIGLSLPIFDNFQRNLAVSQAQAQQEDARESIRAAELQVRTDIQSRYLALQTAFKVIAVQQTTVQVAREQLNAAQTRYRLGQGTSIDVSDALNAVQRAEGDLVSAIYEYHRAVASLEMAVGRPLR